MKIGQNNDHAASIAQTSQSAVAKAGQEASVAAKNDRKSPGVGVTVSTAARALEKGASSAPDVDVEKVKQVREAIANKTYVVDAEAIADKLLAGAADLLQATRRQ